jgi:hypothetical protein
MGLRNGVRQKDNRERFPLGSDQLVVESNDILEGSLGGWIVDEKNTLGPSQVSEEASVSNERTRSYPFSPITIPEDFTRPLNDIQD